eukprot:TRINITY_DN4504_c0_g2_i1.p1 TRINITY_DN4504_c0_g2~~TRINITY_DN4504_c0_g2_i1.p1  ORF type:complete len:470 (+),score=160.62 TRINITY_DN4504_c0_g2_i1:302-1711(+)
MRFNVTSRRSLSRVPIRLLLLGVIVVVGVYGFVLSVTQGRGNAPSSPLDRLATYMPNIFDRDPDEFLKQVDPAGFALSAGLPAAAAGSDADAQPTAAAAPSAVAPPQHPPHYWLSSESLDSEDWSGEPPVRVVSAGGTVWLVAGWPVENCSVPCYFDREGSGAHVSRADADGVVYIGTRPLSDPPPRNTAQVAVLFHSESDALYPDQRRTYEMLGNGLDVCACYHQEHDAPIAAARKQRPDDFEMMTITYSSFALDGWTQQRPTPWEDLEQEAIAVMLISNCGFTSSGRMEVVEQLSKYIKIDSYGACMKNRDQPKKSCAGLQGWDQKLCIMRQYKFYLAFENSIDDSYVTEKFWMTLYVGSIPVYLGADNIMDMSPTRLSGKPSFLQVKDFATIEELGRRMNFLASNRTEYENYVEWRWRAPFEAQFERLIYAGLDLRHTGCTLCKHVARVRRRKLAALGRNATTLAS